MSHMHLKTMFILWLQVITQKGRQVDRQVAKINQVVCNCVVPFFLSPLLTEMFVLSVNNRNVKRSVYKVSSLNSISLGVINITIKCIKTYNYYFLFQFFFFFNIMKYPFLSQVMLLTLRIILSDICIAPPAFLQVVFV